MTVRDPLAGWQQDEATKRVLSVASVLSVKSPSSRQCLVVMRITPLAPRTP